jgi:ketosteroid isomerase-like protein
MSDDNVAIVRRVYEAMQARDAEALRALYAPEIEVFQASELPWGGHYRGHDGVFAFFMKLVEHIDSAVTHDGIFAAGDRVVQHGRTKGTVRATGVSFDIDEVHVYTVQDGKIVRFEAFIDTPAMLAALAGS